MLNTEPPVMSNLSMEVKVTIMCSDIYHQYRAQTSRPRKWSQHLQQQAVELLFLIEEVYGEVLSEKMLFEILETGLDINKKELALLPFECLQRLANQIHDSPFEKELRNQILHEYLCVQLQRLKADALLIYNTRFKLMRGNLKESYKHTLYCLIGADSDTAIITRYMDHYERVCSHLNGAMHLIFDKRI